MERMKRNTMRANKLSDVTWTLVFITLLAIACGGRQPLGAQTLSADAKRQAKHLVQPNPSELARKLNLTGTVRVEVTIAPDGTVKRTRIIGGHPVLAADAERAAQKSTFEAGPVETTEVLEFRF
jgi:TonB family protein